MNNKTSVLPTQERQIQNSIRILLVDDLETVRQMLRLSLESEPDIDIVGSAADGSSALEAIEKLYPDLALVDIEMPGMDGLTVAEKVCSRFSQTKVLIFSSYDDVNYIKKALAVGAKGYLLKSTPTEELLHAIRYIHKGYLQLGPGLFEKLESETLTEGDRLNAAKENVATTIDPDWSDSTQEYLDVLPRVWTRGLLYAIVIFTAIILPWATLSKVDVIGKATGRLEPKGKTIRLDAPIAGTVAAIKVKEGQKVKAGQVLIELNSKIVRGELQQAQARQEGLVNRLNNLQMLESQLKINASTQGQQNKAQASEQQELINQTQQKTELNRTTITSVRQLLSKDSSRVKRYRYFRQQGAVSGNQLEDVERQVIENEQRLKQTQSELAQNHTELKKQRKAYQRILYQGAIAIAETQKQLKEVRSQIIDTRSEIAQTQNRLQSLQYQEQQSVLYAPNDGTIFELSIRHPGAVVQPGVAIATIAPQGVPLVLRGRMSSSESGFLQPGMPVKIKFDAYPFQDYGIVPGQLSWISPDSQMAQKEPGRSQEEEKAQEREGVFELEITLDRTYIQTTDRQILLTPGQTATAEVVIRQRRVIDFFLDPFKKLQKTGLEL
jgi:hemolysin D